MAHQLSPQANYTRTLDENLNKPEGVYRPQSIQHVSIFNPEQQHYLRQYQHQMMSHGAGGDGYPP